MASLIDNRKRTLVSVLKTELTNAESIDISTAFFYFSGFNLIAEDLKDKKVRILVGMEIDPSAMADLSKALKKDNNPTLEKYTRRDYSSLTNSAKKKDYLDGFVNLVNESPLSSEFDYSSDRKALDIFLDKILDGSLEIKLNSKEDNHSKYYVIKYKEGTNLTDKGTAIMGSSNLTYGGLLGQDEINEEIGLYDPNKYDEYAERFEEVWNDPKNIDVCVDADNMNIDFVEDIKKRLSIYSLPTPFEIYLRILSELYSNTLNDEIETPSKITRRRYIDLKYQLDAIKYGINCIKKNNGVIIADVVGLGKSIVASAIAHNLRMPHTIIIAPPHLVEQWNDYVFEFSIPGARVQSSGKIEELYNDLNSKHYNDPTLFIIDEAHRYRNEENINYQYLHQMTRMNPGNKVMLLTATPYNNRPQDIFALIKLFQTPSKSTINTVDNLDYEFHRIITRYGNLEKKGKKDQDVDTKNELARLGEQLRTLIDPIVVRRSRIDLTKIDVYRNDLNDQHITFPKVMGPELIEYDLGDIKPIYIDTLQKLTDQLKCARYCQTSYLIDKEKFLDDYGDIFIEKDIVQSQENLAKFIRNLLVMRFESSKAAFKKTLEHIIKSYEITASWWKKGFVPISLKGGSEIDDPDDDENVDLFDEYDNLDELDAQALSSNKKYRVFKKDLFTDDYFDDLTADTDLLKEIYNMWFSSEDELGSDPKYDRIIKEVDRLLDEDKNRKIVIFSSYTDTAKYVQGKLKNNGYRSFLYTGQSSKNDMHVVKENFDASYDGEQKNNYDVLVATDALSEGFNLNRAGVIINYDIPYNPTRVIQRIGRINRINKKVFDELYIYNCFPTDIGEENALVKGISTLKMLLIQNVVGSDTRTLTPDEDLTSYFKRQYDEANKDNDEESWDIEYRNTYERYKNNVELMDTVNNIPVRSKIVRKGQPYNLPIAYINKGDRQIFTKIDGEGNVVTIAPSEALKYFAAEKDEEPYPLEAQHDVDIKIFNGFIDRSQNKLKNTNTKNKALDNVNRLMKVCAGEKNYLNDLERVISEYDDLTDGEIRDISRLKCGTVDDCEASIKELKEKIPSQYLNNITDRAESIDSEFEKIVFIEELEKS